APPPHGTEAFSQSIPRQLFSRSEKIIKSSTTTTKKDTAQRIVNQSGCESFGGWPIQRRNRSPSMPLIIPRREKRPRNRRSAPASELLRRQASDVWPSPNAVRASERCGNHTPVRLRQKGWPEMEQC